MAPSPRRTNPGGPLVDIAFLIGGLVLLIGGGDLLVRGASRLAALFGVPPLVIGLTVVAFGTSAPELAVNILGALDGRTALAFGNILGSNLSNIGLILGLAAILAPIDVHGEVTRREIPMAFVTLLVAIVIVLDPELGVGIGQVDRIDGIVLLVFFGVFIYYTTAGLLRERAARAARGGVEPPTSAAGSAVAEAVEAPRDSGGILRACFFTLAGLVGLLLGGEGTVRGAVRIAQAIGLSEELIGFTIVAVGTSLPELASTLVAVRRREADIAVGNIVGSNIFNTTLVLGSTSAVAPVAVPPGGRLDLGVTLAFTLALLLFSWTGRGLCRREGVVLLVGYAGYIVMRVAIGDAG